MNNKKIDPLFLGFGFFFILYTLSLLISFVFNTFFIAEDFVDNQYVRMLFRLKAVGVNVLGFLMVIWASFRTANFARRTGDRTNLFCSLALILLVFLIFADRLTGCFTVSRFINGRITNFDTTPLFLVLLCTVLALILVFRMLGSDVNSVTKWGLSLFAFFAFLLLLEVTDYRVYVNVLKPVPLYFLLRYSAPLLTAMRVNSYNNLTQVSQVI